MNLAQLSSQVQLYEPFMRYGLLGAVLSWFMFKMDGRLERIEKAIVSNTHSVTGFKRTMLIEIISRETISLTAKQMAKEELEKSDFTKTT